ncbi:MAG: hypothetical protein R8J85_02540 [Mariprofundales bacterium]
MSVIQPPLALSLPQILTHDGWVNHDGVASAASALALWSLQGGEVWLRSEHRAGKSHLLQALASELDGAQLLQVSGDSDASDSSPLIACWLQQLQQGRWWLIDLAAGRISTERQLALFHLIEHSRRDGVPLVVSWRGDDATLIKPELLTRLRAMQQLVLHPPTTDEDLFSVLEAALTRMQWRLKSSVLRYIMDHTERDLTQLLTRLHALHQHSLQRQCRPSLVNIRQLLAETT